MEYLKGKKESNRKRKRLSQTIHSFGLREICKTDLRLSPKIKIY